MIVHVIGVEIYNGPKDGKQKHWQRLTVTQPMASNSPNMVRVGKTAAQIYVEPWLGIEDRELVELEDCDVDLVYDTQLGQKQPSLIEIRLVRKEDQHGTE